MIRDKAELTLGEWNRVFSECQRRKCVLNKMVDDSRLWDQLRCSVQLWLTDAQERLMHFLKNHRLYKNKNKYIIYYRLNEGISVNAATENALVTEITSLEEMVNKVDEMREKMAELNNRSDALLDEFRVDEGHNLSHITSKMNTLWSRFNDK